MPADKGGAVYVADDIYERASSALTVYGTRTPARTATPPSSSRNGCTTIMRAPFPFAKISR